jgi:hypothetical protein
MQALKAKIAITTLLAFILTPAIACAADPDVVSVYDQARSLYIPQGLQYGSFIYSPSVALDETYDDNIYRKPNRQSDLISILSPGMRINSDFDLYTLGLGASGDFGVYHNHTAENFQDYRGGANAGWSMDYDTGLEGAVRAEHGHDDRSSPDDPGGDHPVEYNLSTQTLSFYRTPGLLKLYLDATRDHLTFDNSEKSGVIIDNTGRDRNVYTADGKLAYEYFPGYEVYISTIYDTRRYIEAAPLNKDSSGYEFRAGADLDITGKVKGNVYIGKFHRSYKSSLPNINAVNYGGSLLWNITGLTSISGVVERAIDESALIDTGGALRTTGTLSLQHSLKQNLFVIGDTGYSTSSFRNNGLIATRTDKNYNAGVRLEYLPFDRVSASLGYQYFRRNSTEAGADYSDNRIMLTGAYSLDVPRPRGRP